MPTLQARLWYVGMSSKAWGMVTFAKNTTVLCALVTLACECAVTGTAWDLLPCLPLLGGALAVLYATYTLSPACKSYLNKQLSAKPWKGKGGGTAGRALASIAPEARASMSSAHHAKDPVGALGGCGPAALLLSEANILSDSDASSSHEATQRLVDSAIKGIVSSAVVAALIFSTMYEFAYEEGEALQRLVAAGPASGWGIEEVADLTSCVADFVCILMASVAILLGSILYSQISYWMPSLEARLWYLNASSRARAAVDLATYVTVFSALLSLACQVAVTRSAWDILPFLPLLAVGLAMLYIQCTLSRDCKHYLTAELRLRPLGDGGALDA